MPLYVISSLCLAGTAFFCGVGLISRTYKDNLFQCLGMAILMIGTSSRAAEVWGQEFIRPDWFMVHVGMFLFAFGVFVKVFLKSLNEKLEKMQRAIRGPQTTPDNVNWLK